MPEIRNLKTPQGTTYEIRDSRVDNLNNFQYAICTAASDTPQGITWDNNGTTVTGTLAASAATMYKIYLVPSSNGVNDNYDEYITLRTGTEGSYAYAWELMGYIKLPDLSGYVSKAEAGDLAYKNSASGTFTPQGSVSKPTITPTKTNVPNVTDVGSMPTFTVQNETLIITAGTAPTLGSPIEVMTGALVSAPTFTGTQGTVTVN